MRKFWITVATAAMAAIGLTAAGSPAGALVVGDVGVGLTGRPAKVSPPGGLVLYTASATNNGLVAIDVTLTDTSSAGTVVSVSQPACSVSGTTVTCAISQLAAGQTFSVDVVVRTPLSPGSVTNTASATSTLNVDLDANNNSASVSTPVVNDPLTSMAFVPGGGSITYKTHTLYVPASSPGLFVILNDALVAPNTDCLEGTVCGPGVHLDFGQDPYYKALDPNDPVRFVVAFPNEDPCHGSGNPGCVGVAYRTSPTGPIFRVPYCQGASATVTGPGKAIPTPCVNKVTKNGGTAKYAYDVLLLSNDPDLLPPIKLGG